MMYYGAPEISDFGATGNYLVALQNNDPAEVERIFAKTCGLKYTTTADYGGAHTCSSQPEQSLLHFRSLGIALLRGDQCQMKAARTVFGDDIEPEGLVRIAPSSERRPRVEEDDCEPRDERGVTWGLSETKVSSTRWQGDGIKICVLDSGIDLDHPAFKPKFDSGLLMHKSFIGGPAMVDEMGHGSHCAGTLFGGGTSEGHLRFGIAPNAIAYVGRIFRRGSIATNAITPDREVINAINWAIEAGCAVVSMSFGRRPLNLRSYSRTYEQLARRALAKGTLLIAAAGNDSSRFEGSGYRVEPIHEPANCPSILAVGALDDCGNLAFNSNGDDGTSASKIDLCGPGANILSAWTDGGFRRIHGTSAATPFVAGIAALYAQAHDVRGRELWNMICSGARPIPRERRRDVGAGLVRAP